MAAEVPTDDRVRSVPAAGWILGSVAFIGVVVVAGLGLVAVLGPVVQSQTWIVWGNVGQAFGVLASVLSGLALAAVVIVFRAQRQEIANQQTELALQREYLREARAELHRSAEANLRMLHVDLIRLALDDPQLADVWPISGVPADRRRQYLYANLIVQHAWLQERVSVYSEEEMRSNLRYLFESPVIREFWRTTMNARDRVLVPETPEFRFAQQANAVCREYDAVLAQAEQPAPGKSA